MRLGAWRWGRFADGQSAMKITSITLWQVPLTSHDVYYMSDGKACDTVTTTVLRLDTDTGLSGWGEVCPIPHYLPAFAHGVLPVIADLAPVVLGQDPRGPAAVMDAADRQLQGHVYAKSALDIALWDLTARAADMPLFRSARRSTEPARCPPITRSPVSHRTRWCANGAGRLSGR